VIRGRSSLEDDVVWVREPSLDACAREELVRWLSSREEVRSVEAQARTRAIVARYRERATRRGAFVRMLHDKVFLLRRLGRRSEAPAPVSLQLIHELPGRARFRVLNAGQGDVLRLAAWLERRPFVRQVGPSEAASSILVLFDASGTSGKAIEQDANRTRPSEWPRAKSPRTPQREAAKTAFNTAVLGAATLQILPGPLAAVFVGATAMPMLRRAARALREGRASVDLLDLAAVTLSLGRGEVATAALVTWLLGIGDLILERTSEHARDALAKLARFDVPHAWVVRGDRLTRTSAKKLRRGDRIRVHAGEQVPADGTVVTGVASVDEKALTGESLPRTKSTGARVLAATVLRAGQLDVDVTHAGAETAAAKIVSFLEGAEAKPMVLQRQTERVADLVVLPTFGLAGLAGALASDLSRTTSVLITDFGTGIRIAAPTSALAAMTSAAWDGVLVKGGQYLERLSKVDVLVCDKTGTLTEGEPRIVDVVRVGSLDDATTLALAAAAEATQSHPVALAVRRHARERLGTTAFDNLDVQSREYDVGLGVRAIVDQRSVMVGGHHFLRGHGVDVGDLRDRLKSRRGDGASVFVAVDGQVELGLTYADVIRDETRAVITAIRAGGRRELVLMSGDGHGAVESTARALGIERAFARMLPEDKACEIRAMKRQGRVVAMIGDGINDAPALAVADVGISIRGATDVALETADVILVDGGLSGLPGAFSHADIAMETTKRGLAIVLVPNVAAIVLGAMGLLTPGLATVVNNGSTVAAALASLRPLAFRANRARAP
jgi:Cu2+-exporting ATPase